jgi:hypothetical protein
MLIFLIAILLAPNIAHAYLDPGSGAVLINLLIAGFAALLFSLKGFFLRLIGKKTASPKPDYSPPKMAILSEGKQYWATFLPIIEALLQRGIPFVYYTLDILDPALDNEHELMQARFLGYGAMANYRAGRIRADYLLCTTPNIGCPGYPIQKSPQVHKLVHVFHSINDLSMYRKGSLDHYDMVFMVGDWQASSIRELEAKRGLEPKELISLGLPYLDLYQRDLKQIEPGERPCILVASSWGQKGLLLTYGIGFIKALAANYRVILRPHPQSYKSEAKAMAAFEKDLQDYAVLWDKQLSPVDSLQQAELLISDTSSIRFDFAFLCQKPVITLEVEAEAMPGFERDDMDELWMDQAATKIGIKLGKEDIPQISRYVDAALKDYDPQSAIAYRDTVIQNFANAGDSIAEYLVELTSPR